MCVFLRHNVNLMLGWWTFSGAPLPIRNIYGGAAPPLHPGWDVTLCDPIWQVISRFDEACCELLCPVTLLYFHIEHIISHFTVFCDVSRCLLELEGVQRMHISAKYTIMLWCTRLHVYISTSLCTCAVDASPTNDNDVIDNAGVLWRHCRRVRKNSSETVLTFLYISSQPPFRFWTWLCRQKATKMTFSMMYCPYGNILIFSCTSRIYFC